MIFHRAVNSNKRHFAFKAQLPLNEYLYFSEAPALGLTLMPLLS